MGYRCMSSFYGPKKISIAIPAYTLIEWYYRRIDDNVYSAICNFVDERTESELHELFTKSEWEAADDETKNTIINLNENTKLYIPMIYLGNESCGDWNFENLTYKPCTVWLKYQRFLQKQAEIYLKLPVHRREK